MKVYINDLSFQDQANSHDDAVDLLMEVVQTFYNCKAISCEKKGAINSNLKNRPIFNGMSIIQLMHNMKPHEKTKKIAMLEVLCKKPHFNNKHINNDTITDGQGNDLRGTCFDSASISKCGAIVVSAKKSKFSNQISISVNSSISGTRKILNIDTPDDAKLLKWIYEPNKKHATKPKNLGTFIISEMDLKPAEAQEALTNGVYFDTKVISFYRDSWYCFPYHIKPYFHGYKITLQNNNTMHSEVLRVLQLTNFSKRGQIFHDYC